MDCNYEALAASRETYDLAAGEPDGDELTVPVYEVWWHSPTATGKFRITAEHAEAELVARGELSPNQRLDYVVCVWEPSA